MDDDPNLFNPNNNTPVVFVNAQRAVLNYLHHYDDILSFVYLNLDDVKPTPAHKEVYQFISQRNGHSILTGYTTESILPKHIYNIVETLEERHGM